MTKKIEFIDSTGKKTTIFPNEINGYSKADVANYLSIDINNEKDFAKIVNDGNITLLTYTQQTANTFMGPSQYVTYFLYNRLTHKTQRVIQLNFKESMAEYFSDYPELQKMIINKELRYNDLEIIVEKYNKWKQKVN
jgi:hypothetical protein